MEFSHDAVIHNRRLVRLAAVDGCGLMVFHSLVTTLHSTSGIEMNQQVGRVVQACQHSTMPAVPGMNILANENWVTSAKAVSYSRFLQCFCSAKLNIIA